MSDMIFRVFEENRNDELASEMAAYMKNKFPFLGIKKPQRAELSKSFLKTKRKEATIDWDFVDTCFQKEEREYQYLAMDYLISVKARLTADDIGKIETLILTKSWWDSVDALDKLAMEILSKYPETKERIIKWADSDNIWLKRVSIDLQRHRNKKTDTELLTYTIERNMGTNEFFIDKAIGWALRAYSKTDPEWVRTFLNEHKLSKLSIREASKYL